ncbi:glycoside hydrolase family 13 protein [Streptomyces sp. BI20]|uniref:glycoside hydrolase family 13 protein n=1 Tax=Streptomyces sp. BI20 TaxID=3403460 RepID=UPI003C7852B4
MTHESTTHFPADPAGGPLTGPPPARAWWRDAVVYQIYVRSFADSDGDGIGDLRGVRDRLPHLARLGVDALWLTPFYRSPQADGGYDVADHRAVDPRFGDLDDAVDLIGAAHALGLRVLVDLVANHTSEAHPWFEAARAARPGSPERARYHFRPGRGPDGAEPPNDWPSLFGGPAWTRLGTPPDDGDWYLHLFAPEQPDLNWEHPEVRAEFAGVLEFWLELGVDGFRVDVAHGMVKAPGLPDHGGRRPDEPAPALLDATPRPWFDQDGVHEIHRSWRRLLDSWPGERIAVAEAWAPTPDRLARYVRPDELHQAFNLALARCPWEAGALRAVVDGALAAEAAVGASPTWVLSNHDTVRHRTRFGSLARARAAALLMLALPGSAYLYQGEELGLEEVADLPDGLRADPALHRGAGAGGRAGRHSGLRDGCRVPLPWGGDRPPFAFGPEGSWLPQPAGWAALTVAEQTGDPHSTLELYRAALELRRALPGLGAPEAGPLVWSPSAEGVLLFTRPGFACTVNTLPEPVELAAPGRPVLSSAPITTDGRRAALPADSCTWWSA